MELRHLKYFKAVAEARSFINGARYLRVAQPALSRAIAQLEEEIGHALFVRHSTGVSLTDAGVVFYEHANVILDNAAQLSERMAEEGILRGTITLGASQSIQSKVATPIATAFLKEFPQCSINLVQGSSDQMRDGITDGVIDIAIISRNYVNDIHHTPLLSESFSLFINRNGPSPLIADNGDIDLTGCPLITSGYTTGQQHYFEQKLKKYCEYPWIRSQTNSSALMLELVAGGVGIGVAASCVAAQPLAENMQVVPISALEIPWSIATNRIKKDFRIVRTLRTMIINYVQSEVENGLWPAARFE